jgi:acyl-coenzyme A synthetase/AMP-(fatty) acid ligase
VAYVTTRGGGIDGETLRRYCQDGIAGYKVPWEIVILPRLPTTETGKILRRALTDDAAGRVGARPQMTRTEGRQG